MENKKIENKKEIFNISAHNKMCTEIDSLIVELNKFNDQPAEDAKKGLVVALKRINELYLLQYHNPDNDLKS